MYAGGHRDRETVFMPFAGAALQILHRPRCRGNAHEGGVHACRFKNSIHHAATASYSRIRPPKRSLPFTAGTLSQHLKVLKDARLVVDRRAGNRRIYQMDPEGIGALRAYLDQFWSRALAAYESAVEQRAEEVP